LDFPGIFNNFRYKSFSESTDGLKLLDLPDDVLFEIFGYLDVKSRLILTLCCKKIYILIGESSALLKNLVPKMNVYQIGEKSQHYKALQNSRRKYKKCIFTGTMTYKNIKFPGQSMRGSMKFVEFNNISLNVGSFVDFLESFANLEEISLENIQVEGRVPKKRVELKKLRRLTLNAVEDKDTLFDLLSSWPNIKELKIESSNNFYNELISRQLSLELLEVEKIYTQFMNENFNSLVKFQLKCFISKRVIDNGFLINFLNTQKCLEELNLILTIELEKKKFKDLLTIIFGQEKLRKLSFLFPETSIFEDLGFFSQVKSNLKELKLGAYKSLDSVDQSSFIAAFISSLPLLEELNLQFPHTSLTRTVGGSINRSIRLKRIILNDCSGEILDELSVPTLQSLEINQFKGENSDWFMFFTNNQRIKELKILTATEKNYLDEETLQQLTLLENLESLELTVPNSNTLKNFIGKFGKLKSALIQIANRNMILDEELMEIFKMKKWQVSREFWFLKLS
jgi:hypothetical protein